MLLGNRIEGLRHAGPPSVSTTIDVVGRDDDEDIDLVNIIRADRSRPSPLVPAAPPGAAHAGRPSSSPRALKAIADPARLRLLSLIQAQPDHEACVCHLTEPLGLSQPTVSHHLKVLLQAGLVEREQRGSWAYFRIREEPLALCASFSR